MATSQRVSRGFHRLGLFLAAIPLLFGIGYSLTTPLEITNYGLIDHREYVCAHNLLQSDPKRFWDLTGEVRGSGFIDLKAVGCSDRDNALVVRQYVTDVPPFNWWRSYSLLVAPILALAAVASLAVYGIVRAIGWVIGGFAAS